jgi:hypothetical protein
MTRAVRRAHSFAKAANEWGTRLYTSLVRGPARQRVDSAQGRVLAHGLGSVRTTNTYTSPRGDLFWCWLFADRSVRATLAEAALGGTGGDARLSTANKKSREG